MIDMVSRFYILTSQFLFCHYVFPAFSKCFLSLLPLFLLFSSPPFRVFYNLLTSVLQGCFTPIGLIHLLLFSPFLSFFSSRFSFSSFSLSFLPSLPFLSLSLQILVRRPPPCRTASDGPVCGCVCGGCGGVCVLKGGLKSFHIFYVHHPPQEFV